MPYDVNGNDGGSVANFSLQLSYSIMITAPRNSVEIDWNICYHFYY